MADTAQIQIRPPYAEKFRPAAAKALITQVLTERLADKTYNPESTAQLTREIADEIKRCRPLAGRRRVSTATPTPHASRRRAAADSHPPPPTAAAQQAEERARAAALQVCGAGRHRRGPRRVRAHGVPMLLGRRDGQLCGGHLPQRAPPRAARRHSAPARPPHADARPRRAQDSLFCVAAAYGAYLY